MWGGRGVLNMNMSFSVLPNLWLSSVEEVIDMTEPYEIAIFVG